MALSFSNAVPGPTLAIRAAASTLTSFMRLVSRTMPSFTEKPAVLWPPERQATFRPTSVASARICCTSVKASQ